MINADINDINLVRQRLNTLQNQLYQYEHEKAYMEIDRLKQYVGKCYMNKYKTNYPTYYKVIRICGYSLNSMYHYEYYHFAEILTIIFGNKNTLSYIGIDKLPLYDTTGNVAINGHDVLSISSDEFDEILNNWINDVIKMGSVK